jgi:hypothetical protein
MYYCLFTYCSKIFEKKRSFECDNAILYSNVFVGGPDDIMFWQLFCAGRYR